MEIDRQFRNYFAGPVIGDSAAAMLVLAKVILVLATEVKEGTERIAGAIVDSSTKFG